MDDASKQTAVVFRSPAFSGDNLSPVTSISGPLLKWNPRDEIFRRFSDPAKEAEREKVVAQFTKAEDTYLNAVQSLRKILKKDEIAQLTSSTNCQNDLHRVAVEMQEAKSVAVDGGRVREFCKVLDQYQGVFDVLSQAEFSGLPLIWGGLKFVLLMSKNSSNLLSDTMDMMINIGHNLERVKVYAALYPTPRILQFTADLYIAVVKFLEKIIAKSRQGFLKRKICSSVRSFKVQYGDLIADIERIETDIMKDANVCQHITTMTTSHSLAIYRRELAPQGIQMVHGLKGIAEDQSAFLFQDIRTTLFHGFELEAGYHEELERAYKMTTSAAWLEWFSIEQKYVPSNYSHKSKLVQAECDAPDPQHALLWKAQQRQLASHVPSTYLIWTRGMTAQSAIGSLIYQILMQMPDAVFKANLDLTAFKEANMSIRVLWNLFLHLIKALGGCMVYLSICSVGEEEFAIVQKFVTLVEKWDGPPINITLIHPFHQNFARGTFVVDLDEKYDVHPSLTTTDAMHHVLLLTLNVHKRVSDTVQSLLWETVWRETRYAVNGIALTQLIDKLQLAAEKAADRAQPDRDGPFSEADRTNWLSAVGQWTNNKWSMNKLREQIQRHLDIVDIHIPPEIKTRLVQKLRRVLLLQEEEIESHALFEKQRMAIWEGTQAAIQPGTQAMFCDGVPGLMATVLEEYRSERPESEGEAKALLLHLIKPHFGKNGTWQQGFSLEKELIAEGIVRAIETGFEDVVEALVTGKVKATAKANAKAKAKSGN